MKKQNLILSAALVAVFSASTAFAEAEVTGKIVHESGFFSNTGSTIGNQGSSVANATDGNAYYGMVTTATTPIHGENDQFKSESTAKIYIDGEIDEINEGATYHVELNLMKDGKAGKNYKSNETYTQRDAIREAYVDTMVEDWSIRTGKQQVVWGTADGMKLLDMINPTDYGEMAQNQMEDSRIPVWMINAETTNADGSEFQAIVSEPKENVFAGLNRNVNTEVRSNGYTGTTDITSDSTLNNGTDQGHAFMMMGPDSITGVTNGFLNITPDLGSVATRFAYAFVPSSVTTTGINTGAGVVPAPMVLNALTGAYTIGGESIQPDAYGVYSAADSAKLASFNGAIGGAGAGSLNSQLMEGFTVGGFSGMTMAQMDNSLSPAAAGGTGTADSNTLINIPAGFRKAVADTWGGIYNQTKAALTAAGATSDDAAIRSAIFVNLKMDGLKKADGTTAVTAANVNTGDLTGGTMLDAGFQPLYNTNLSSFGDGNADSAFEYMTNTTFRTFDGFANAKSQYVYNMPKSDELDLALRFKNSTANGVNYSLNTSYNYDKNPIINLSWRGDSGQELTTHEVTSYYTMDTTTGALTTQTKALHDAFTNTASDIKHTTKTLQLVDINAVGVVAPTTTGGAGTAGQTSTSGDYYGSYDVNGVATNLKGVYGGGSVDASMVTAGIAGEGAATLQFSQEVKRVKQIGGSFDTAIETAALGPIVIRGEALYTKDGYSPVMSKTTLSNGDLVGALQMKKADRFKFVLGADITALTNMMISAQFIQDSNLDFIDSTTEYTTDYATMHLSNGFNKGIKDKNFYSLFFSKPFGASGEHRWNNITMLEEGLNGNGKWNRLDAEFSIDDDTQATVEYNKYWGNANTQFGQLEKSSNIQVGVKYSF